MNIVNYLIVVVLAGIAGSFTDWLFMGVLFHDRYNAHPEVWRDGRSEVGKILISTAIGAVASAAFAYLLVRAGWTALPKGLLAALLVTLAAPGPLLASNGLWIKIHAFVTAAHIAGWLARFVVTAVIASFFL